MCTLYTVARNTPAEQIYISVLHDWMLSTAYYKIIAKK